MEFYRDDLDVDSDFEPSIRYAWSLLLGVAGCMDLLATLALALSEPADPTLQREGVPRHPSSSSPPFARWIVDHGVGIGLAFSSLYFCNAFFDARRRKRKLMSDRERRRLLHREECPPSTTWWNDSSHVYLETVALQLLLLPIGFYVFLFRGTKWISLGSGSGATCNLDGSLNATAMDCQQDWQHESFSERGATEAVIVVVLQQLGLSAVGVTTRAIGSKVAELKKKVTRFALGRLVRNPLRFRRDVKILLARIRYAKYLAPIIGTANKLNGNLQDLRKKRRQRREKKIQKRIREMFWEKKPVALRREHSAVVLQSAYRSHRMRKAKRAMLMIRTEKYTRACLKVQHVFRRKLKEARVRLERKKEEYERLQTEASRGGIKSGTLSMDEKKRMYVLQEELLQESRKVLNQKMLMRPNTKFAVYWRLLFVLCVTLEIARLAAKPLLDRGKAKEGGAPRTMGGVVAEALVPVRISELPQCMARTNKRTPGNRAHTNKRTPESKGTPENKGGEGGLPWYCEGPFSALQEAYVDVVALALVPVPAVEWQECLPEKENKRAFGAVRGMLSKKKRAGAPPRWYCEGTYATLHSVYRNFVDFFLEKFSTLVGIICFLDVPVTFFIGEIHPESGVLVPKPPFARWVVPGLLLQLLVNPQMGTASIWATAALRGALAQGPVRVYRLAKVVAFPLVYGALKLLVRFVWLPLVEFENGSRTFVRGLL